MHRAFLLLLLMVLLFGVSQSRISWSQSGQFPPIRVPDNRASGRANGVPSDMQKKMQKKANVQRQAELRRDTEKLLKLSTELKDLVDKTNENLLSLDVIKKAEEIEKLAHNVKTKMRGEQYGANPDIP